MIPLTGADKGSLGREENMTQIRRQVILDTVAAVLADLFVYDRKEGEVYGLGEIEAAIAAGEITVEELVELFRAELEKSA